MAKDLAPYIAPKLQSVDLNAESLADAELIAIAKQSAKLNGPVVKYL
jgi:hypothetical protein